MNQPHGPTPARNLATMRSPLHPAGLGTIIERRPRQPLPSPGRRIPLPRYGFVVAIVVAHEAEHRLTATLDSLDAQTRRPDAVIVVADRCTDATVVTALVHGATVVETSDNHQGCPGALDLALAEVLSIVDEDDVVLMVGDGVALTPTFVATGLRQLWSTSPTRNRWGRTAQPPSLITATPAFPASTTGSLTASRGSVRRGATGRCPAGLLGAGWPGGQGLSGSATMVLAGALKEVAAARRARTMDHHTGGSGALDPSAVHPEMELLVALDALGHRTATTDEALAIRHTGTPPGPRDLFHARRQTQRVLLTALGSHGVGRHTRRSAAVIPRLGVELAAPLAAAAGLATLAATGGPVVPLAAAIGVATLLWAAERAWATRHAGRHLPGELVRGLVRATAAGAGVVTGTWEWLVGLRWRRKVWRHPVSGRVLARRPGPFPSAPPVSLVRVPGAAIVIERSAQAPDVVAERWRRRALAGCAGTLTLVTVVGLPVLFPLPMAAAVGAWATVTAVVSVNRLVRSTRGGRARG